ncbi:MAG: 2-hydroxyacid dehydrogenase [Chloroflexi bacterium]|nr:2-hydroxyacid dehydrogenase [Chloroflexota bacterium]
MPTILFLDTVAPEALERLRAYVPSGLEFIAAGSRSREGQLALAREADYLLVWQGGVDAEMLAAAPRARLIQKVGQGTDNIDREGARARGVPVCNTGGANTTSVAEYTILLMMAVHRRFPWIVADVREGLWPNFKYRRDSWEINGKKIGIIGLGTIGRKVARRLQGWECELAYHDVAEIPPDVERDLGIRRLPKEDLLSWADIVTLHVFLDERSRGLIGARELERMKPTALLINASRGPVVDEKALIHALRTGQIAGAGLDVLGLEPVDPRSPLLKMENVVVTSHVAAGTWDALERTIAEAMENIRRVEAGHRPENIQNGL